MAKKSKNPKQEIIASAVNMGVGEIIRLHPRFTNAGQYIASHINSQGVSQMFDKIYKHAQRNNMPKDKIGEYIAVGLANYIASGRAFDNSGKETILRTSLEAKAGSGLFKGFSARRELSGDKYLDHVIGAWSKINAIAKAGGQEVPEDMAKPLKYLDQLGFAVPAVEILQESGLLKGNQYHEIKNEIRKGAYESHTEALGKLQEYSHYQKAAALLIGGIGLALLLASGMNFTGGVIGANAGKNLFLCFIGVCSLVSSLVLFARKPRRI